MNQIFWGAGSNGKTCLITTALGLLGDYAMSLPAGMLLQRPQDAHPTELADLRGIRLAITSEVPEGCRFNEERIKRLVGGDNIRARRMRENFFEFAPTHKLIMATNFKPDIRGTDHAIWRRIRLTPFTVVIPDERQDTALPERLKEEYSGILNWMLAGCADWQESGLAAPEGVIEATQAYRTESDVLGEWIADRCEVSPELQATTAELYDAYLGFCEATRQRPLSRKWFSRRLGDRPGITPWRSKSARGWAGIRPVFIGVQA